MEEVEEEVRECLSAGVKKEPQASSHKRQGNTVGRKEKNSGKSGKEDSGQVAKVARWQSDKVAGRQSGRQ